MVVMYISLLVLAVYRKVVSHKIKKLTRNNIRERALSKASLEVSQDLVWVFAFLSPIRTCPIFDHCKIVQSSSFLENDCYPLPFHLDNFPFLFPSKMAQLHLFECLKSNSCQHSLHI